MREFLLKLRRRVALALYPIDIVELNRHQLGGVSHSELHYDLDEVSLKQMASYCYGLRDDRNFKRITDTIIEAQIDFIAKQATSLELVAFGRATINGVSLVRDEIERLASIHEEQTTRNNEYNRFDVV